MDFIRFATFAKLSHHLRLILCTILLVFITPAGIAQNAHAEPVRPIPRASFIAATDTTPQNIILLIGDGMGPEQVIAAGMYENGVHNTLAFESAPYQAKMSTASANSPITDSAASATAMATGQKVNNGVISKDMPGNGRNLETSLEYFKGRCKSTGIVVTSVINHATPAAFASHATSRVEYQTLLKNYFDALQPNIIMGGGPDSSGDRYATNAGYTIVSNREELNGLTATSDNKVFGRFGRSDMPYELDYAYGMNKFYDYYPHLWEMTAKSLELLEQDPDGFFLMVEGSRIDHASHANSMPHMVHELLAFEKTVETVLNWAEGRTDTLIIVTADHETGGLKVEQNMGKGEFPHASWATSGHSARDVAVYAWGPNAEMVTGRIDNTTIYDITTANSKVAANCEARTIVQPEQPFVPVPIETVDITLRWESSAKDNISGFHIMRSSDEIFDHAQPITSELILISDGDNYEYTDAGIDAASDYIYWLVIVASDGSTTVSDQIQVPRSRYNSFLPLLTQ